jgi:serine/threonine protein kinase
MPRPKPPQTSSTRTSSPSTKSASTTAGIISRWISSRGQNLAQVIGGLPLPAQRAAQYAKTIAETIHFAHQRGTLHRDLKPQNVMIDAADQVRITDFGLAKQLHGNDDLTRTGAVMGSPNYMAPEQAQGRQDLVGPPSDVYAVDTILYELLTGRPPFLADNRNTRGRSSSNSAAGCSAYRQ